MTATVAAMFVDVGILFVIGVCSLILATEDGILTMASRIPYVLTACAALGYSLFLLSEWAPGPTGFPWQRICVDGSIAATLVWRTVSVLIALKKNSGHLLAFGPFGTSKR